MCDPITIASAALMAAGTGANYLASQKVEKARANAMAAERIRQQGFTRQQEAIAAGATDRYRDFNEKQDAKAEDLGQYYATSTNPPPTEAVLPDAGNNVVAAEREKQSAKARDFTTAQGEALGELRSFGDVLGGIGRLQGRDMGEIGQIGSFMRGSNNVLPYELEAANSKGSGLRLLGDVLGGIGSVGMSYGMGKMFMPGAAAAPATAPSLTMPTATAPMTLNKPAGALSFGNNALNPFRIY